MKIPLPDDIESTDTDYEEIICEGMFQTTYIWVRIETSVIPIRETEKAYYAKITVYEVDDIGRCDDIFPEKISWIPKSMSDNPWWICGNIFSHTGKVANRRFDEY